MGDGGDSGGSRGVPVTTVGHALTPLHRAHCGHPGYQAEGRLQIDDPTQPRHRRDSVHGDADTCHIMMRRGMGQKSGRVGGVRHRCRDAAGTQHGQSVVESPQLPCGERHAVILTTAIETAAADDTPRAGTGVGVCVGEVRPRRLEAKPRPRTVQRGRHVSEFGRGGAHAVHAGVDLEVDPPGRARRRQRLAAGHGRDRESNPVGGAAGRFHRFGRDQLRQNQHRSVAALGLGRISGLDGFLEGRHGQPRRPAGESGTDRGDGSVAVAVGFHDCAERHSGSQPDQTPDVGLDSGSADESGGGTHNTRARAPRPARTSRPDEHDCRVTRGARLGRHDAHCVYQIAGCETAPEHR